MRIGASTFYGRLTRGRSPLVPLTRARAYIQPTDRPWNDYCRLSTYIGLPVDLRRVESLLSVAEFQGHGTRPAERHRAVEAGAPPGVASARSFLHHLDPHRVLVAVDPHLDHALDVAGAFALAPQLFARAAIVPGLPALDRAPQCVGIHVRDHQDVAAARVRGNAGDQPVRIELGRKREPLLDLVGRAARSKGRCVGQGHSPSGTSPEPRISARRAPSS